MYVGSKTFSGRIENTIDKKTCSAGRNHLRKSTSFETEYATLHFETKCDMEILQILWHWMIRYLLASSHTLGLPT